MNKNFRSGFLSLAERHANAAAHVKALHQSDLEDPRDDVNGLLSQAVAREEEVRAILIAWKPDSNIEAQSKLLYIAQYLMIMSMSLDRHEMAALLNSVAHLRNDERA